MLAIPMMRVIFRINCYELTLTNRQVTKLCKPFANGSSANIRFSRTRKWDNHKIGQPGGFLVKLLKPLLKTGLPLMKNVLKSLTKGVSISLGLKASTLAADAAIHKKMYGSGTRPLESKAKNFKNFEGRNK